MKNEVIYTNSEEMRQIKLNSLSDGATFLAEIDGKSINNLEQYLVQISDLFKFPMPSRSLDSYCDWMRDLEWFEVEGYALVIYNFKNLFIDEPSMKETILEDFEELILPWWQEEVERCVVGGKAKSFNVYLVD